MSQDKKGLCLERVFCFQTCSDFLQEKIVINKNLLKFDLEDPEFAKFEIIRTIQIQIGKINCDFRKSLKIKCFKMLICNTNDPLGSNQ